MAITYPITAPSVLRTASVRWSPVSVVGLNASVYTGQQQAIAHRGGWWEVDIQVPACKRVDSDPLEAFLLSLNGREGTFYYGDKLRATTRGTASGAWVVGSGATANSTMLPISGGSGTFALGDFIQVGNQLFRVIQLNAGSVDVFPKLRTAFAAGATIVYTNPKGLFRLKEPVPMEAGVSRLFGPYTIPLVEVVS